MEKLIINQTSNEVSEIYREAVQTHQRILANGEICAQSLLEICKDLKRCVTKNFMKNSGTLLLKNTRKRPLALSQDKLTRTYQRMNA